MLRKILIAVAVLVAAVLLFAATRPDTFRIERKIVIKAPAEKIFAQVNDLHAWAAWSPWEKMDPQMQRTFSGSPRGVGAIYGWEGNRKVGKGEMEIVDSVPAQRIRIRLAFMSPFEAHNMAEFGMAPVAGGTEVTWAMYGPQPYSGKLIGIFCNMDRVVGADFEAGLAALKTVSEQ